MRRVVTAQVSSSNRNHGRQLRQQVGPNEKNLNARITGPKNRPSTGYRNLSSIRLHRWAIVQRFGLHARSYATLGLSSKRWIKTRTTKSEHPAFPKTTKNPCSDTVFASLQTYSSEGKSDNGSNTSHYWVSLTKDWAIVSRQACHNKSKKKPTVADTQEGTASLSYCPFSFLARKKA